MAITLPLPVRVAVGLVAVGIERARDLPADLPVLSMTVAGHAVRTSMRVRQHIASLASRGDELLSGLYPRLDEHPAWAHFDEDDAPVDTGSPSESHRGGTSDHASPERADNDGRHIVAGPHRGRADARNEPRGAGGPAVSPGMSDGPADMPGYDRMTLAQVRGRLRGLSPAAVGALLDHEQAGTARAPFLTLLANRLTTLQLESS